LLRAYAAQTSPGCTNVNVKSDTATTRGISEKWELLGNAGDPTRDVRMIFGYKVPRGARTADTMVITLYCQ